MMDWARERYPKQPTDSDFVYKQTIKAKACDTLRGLLPAATLSNVGIYGTGQAFEALLLRMRAHPLPEAQMYAQLMLDELRKVIPSFLVRVDRPERGGAWSTYLAATRDDTHALVAAPLRRRAAGAHQRGQPRRLGSRRRGQGARRDLLPAHPPARSAAARAGARARRPTIASRSCTRTSASARIGDTSPAARSSAPAYRFDVLGDYGAFRDLQRHRMLTIEWQQLTPHHGYEMPAPLQRRRAGARATTRRWNDPRRCTPRSSSRSPSRPRTRSRSATACAT